MADIDLIVPVFAVPGDTADPAGPTQNEQRPAGPGRAGIAIAATSMHK